MARSANYPGKLPTKVIPNLGIKNDLGNLMIRFDKNWLKEP